MLSYYLQLAFRSLKRNVALTILMICAIGVGIGASMITVTIFRAMASDPIPGKSTQLYAARVDNRARGNVEELKDQMTYIDATNLLHAKVARRQTIMYRTDEMMLAPSNPQLHPFPVFVSAATADLFPMFEVRFLYGAPWSSTDDEGRSAIAVITSELNDRLFGGRNSVGQTLNVDGHFYRVVGVVDHWRPMPRFYDLSSGQYGKVEDIFVPFSRAIEDPLMTTNGLGCATPVENPGESSWINFQRSDCAWILFWAELPTAADAERFGLFLKNYASEQQHSGRYQGPPLTDLHDVRQWLGLHKVVSDEIRILMLVAFSFLVVCLLTALGLMLAKFMARSLSFGIRRALGASQRAIFAQCLVEVAIIGLAGGLLGLALTAFGLLGMRSVLSLEALELTQLDGLDVAITITLSILATLAAGLYPAWRAVKIQPAWQMKSQ